MRGWHGLRRGPVAQHCKCRWQLQRLQRLQRDPCAAPAADEKTLLHFSVQHALGPFWLVVHRQGQNA